VDLFTDCPSRERAGWLCDSFFTARAEQFFFGDCPIEDAFLENYVLYEDTEGFPRGVLPMCYPSDAHNGLKFIPQWNMWYVLEVAEHLTQRRPHKDREPFRPSVLGILDFLAQYENEEGLLEDLPSWNFVEWSDANRWTAGVNYPTNFLYAATLDGAADTFHLPHLHAKAERIRERARRLAFDGEVFLDHALRQEGVLVNQRRASEAGQYYAILFGGVDLDSAPYAKLKAFVADCFQSFDPRDRAFCPINAFIGLYLRLWVLASRGESALLAKTVKHFCADMCQKTGTLWEYRDGKGSLDHGFASYLATVLPLADTAK
jgi:alpha-L-rhamnosidase